MNKPPIEAVVRAAQHYTLTTFGQSQDGRRTFAFAISDEGAEVYMPASVVQRLKLTPDDVGEGFIALTYAANEQYRYPRVALPVYMDREHPILASLSFAGEAESPLSERAGRVHDIIQHAVSELMRVQNLLTVEPKS